MWISVQDRLPGPAHQVDIWRKGTGRITDCVCHRFDVCGPRGIPLAHWETRCGDYAGGATVTHWMAIRDPHEEVADAQAT